MLVIARLGEAYFKTGAIRTTSISRQRPRSFEPGTVAQLAEQGTHKPKVDSSSLSRATNPLCGNNKKRRLAFQAPFHSYPRTASAYSPPPGRLPSSTVITISCASRRIFKAIDCPTLVSPEM